MDAIQIIDVTKTYARTAKPAVSGLSLTVKPGEILTLLGPSGCGKTTTLRLIAGFEAPDSGCILLRGREVAGRGSWVPPERRGVGMVFQDYALFPHINVARNVGFGLKSKSGREEAVKKALALVGLEGMEARFPGELSGGQQQRVALARALARNPVVVLLDEPFSNLDADLKNQMRREVVTILKEAGAAAVLVTHDQKDALAVSDRIAVMKDGRLEQVGTPREIYQYPDTVFVASFVGRSNIMEGVMAGDGISVITEVGTVLCPHTHGARPGERVMISIRPDSFEPDPDGRLTGLITTTVYGGDSVEAEILVEVTPGVKKTLMVHLHPEAGTVKGETVRFRILPDFVAVIRN